jgi:hypothetical protein
LQFTAEESNRHVWNPIPSFVGEQKPSFGDSDAADPRDLRFVIADGDPTIRELVKTIVTSNRTCLPKAPKSGPNSMADPL